MNTVGAFASIFDSAGRILCVRQNYPPYRWTTPGGRVESGESPIRAVEREALEEAACAVTAERLIGVYAALYKNDLVLSFLCRVRSESEWVPTQEISHRCFFSMDGLPEPMAYNTRVRIQDAFEGKHGTVRVFHLADGTDNDAIGA